MQIKHNITVNINEKVTFALLRINKSLHLKARKANDSYWSLPGKPDPNCMIMLIPWFTDAWGRDKQLKL